MVDDGCTGESSENTAPGFIYLDPDLANVLGDASNAAYDDFSNKSFSKSLSSGSLTFDYHDRFCGLDCAPWGSGNSEKFGLIYTGRSDPSTIVLAFRGTASLLDAFKDLESIGSTPFVPHKSPPGFPNNVHVGDGFFDIYSQSNPSLRQSMQSQLFSILSQLSPRHIIVTGHSLGAPLASLFALDVAVCQPTRLTNINFASPRVGKEAWRNAYSKYVTNGSVAGSPANVTIRIVNNYDLVPTEPTEWPPFSFKHVGPIFPVSFSVDTVPHYIDYLNFPDHVLSWHSLNNYQTVVNCAGTNNPQTWSGKFPDTPLKKWIMISHDTTTRRATPRAEALLAALKK